MLGSMLDPSKTCIDAQSGLDQTSSALESYVCGGVGQAKYGEIG